MKSNVFLARDDLIRQAELLQEISGDIDPATIEELQAAIAYDIHFFEMIHNHETRHQLYTQFIAGDLNIRAGTTEAARILENLILGEP